MKYTKRFNIKMLYDFFEYILAICIVLNCRSMWLMLDENARKFRYIIIVFTVVFSIGCIVLANKLREIKRRNVCILGVLIPYLILYSIVTDYNFEGFLTFLIPFISLFLYYFCCQSGTEYEISLFKKITNVVVVICVVSLFFWITGSLLHIIFPNGYVISKWTGETRPIQVKSYYYIHFEPQVLDTFRIWTHITRNSSIFAEAPMASTVFSLSFLFEILLSEKPRRLILIILGAGILTTLSTTGITIMAAAIFIFYISNKPKEVILRVFKWLFIPLVLAIVIYIGSSLVIERLGTRSGSVRLDDFVVGYKAWVNKLIFGAGFENNEYIQSFMSSWRIVNNGFSNSPMQILAQGGLYIALLYIIAMVKGAYYSLRSRTIKIIAFYIAFIVLFVLVLLSYQYITMIIMFYLSDPMHKKWKNIGHKFVKVHIYKTEKRKIVLSR